jgi:hypothetical protein
MGWKRASFDSEREYDEDDDTNRVFFADGMERVALQDSEPAYVAVDKGEARSIVTCPCGAMLHAGPSRYECDGTFQFKKHQCHFI